MRLLSDHLNLLASLANGSTLKSHRDIEGNKVYRLHGLDGSVQLPQPKIVDKLKHGRYIDSNKKFPAATYLLTDKGRESLSTQLHHPGTAIFAKSTNRK